MVKATTAHFDTAVIDGKPEFGYSGAAVDLTFCIEQGMIDMIRQAPFMRNQLKRTMRNVLRETRNRRAWEWIHSLKVGVFVIPGVYGLMWLIGQISHAFGVM